MLVEEFLFWIFLFSNSLEHIITKRQGLKAHLVYLSSVPADSHPSVFDCHNEDIEIGNCVEIVNFKTKNKERKFRIGKVDKIVRVKRSGKSSTRVHFTTLSGTRAYRSPSNLKVYND